MVSVKKHGILSHPFVPIPKIGNLKPAHFGKNPSAVANYAI